MFTRRKGESPWAIAHPLQNASLVVSSKRSGGEISERLPGLPSVRQGGYTRREQLALRASDQLLHVGGRWHRQLLPPLGLHEYGVAEQQQQQRTGDQRCEQRPERRGCALDTQATYVARPTPGTLAAFTACGVACPTEPHGIHGWCCTPAHRQQRQASTHLEPAARQNLRSFTDLEQHAVRRGRRLHDLSLARAHIQPSCFIRHVG